MTDDTSAIFAKPLPYVNVAEIRKALEQAQAAVWDAHYGNGLSAAYARSVDTIIRAALAYVEVEPRRHQEKEPAKEPAAVDKNEETCDRVVWRHGIGPYRFEVVQEGIGSRLERIVCYEIRDGEEPHLLSTPPVSFLEAALLNVLRQGQFEDFEL